MDLQIFLFQLLSSYYSSSSLSLLHVLGQSDRNLATVICSQAECTSRVLTLCRPLHPSVTPWVHDGCCQQLGMSETGHSLCSLLTCTYPESSRVTLLLTIINGLIASSVFSTPFCMNLEQSFCNKNAVIFSPDPGQCFLPGLDPTHPDVMIKPHVNWA